MAQEVLSLNFREAMQTPSIIITSPEDLLNPNLPPPGELDYQKLKILVKHLKYYPNLNIELPNPISSPTTARNLKELLLEAEKSDTVNKLAVHIRAVEDDMKLAIKCGFKKIYIFGGVIRRNGMSFGTSTELVERLKLVSELANVAGVEYIRASLEHATQTNPSEVKGFIQGIRGVNESLSRPIIKGLGIPDTNGVASPEDYTRLMGTILGLCDPGEFDIFLHLHDDCGRAMENYEYLRNECKRMGFSYCVEAVPDGFPGERVGTRPHFKDIEKDKYPESIVNGVMGGSSWRNAHQTLDSESWTHVAGVHTGTMQTYSSRRKNYPCPGVYSIMGAANTEFLWRLFGRQIPDKKLARQVSKVGREMAARKGNLPQGKSLELAKLAIDNPACIVKMAEAIGREEDWLDKPNGFTG